MSHEIYITQIKLKPHESPRYKFVRQHKSLQHLSMNCCSSSASFTAGGVNNSAQHFWMNGSFNHSDAAKTRVLKRKILESVLYDIFPFMRDMFRNSHYILSQEVLYTVSVNFPKSLREVPWILIRKVSISQLPDISETLSGTNYEMWHSCSKSIWDYKIVT